MPCCRHALKRKSQTSATTHASKIEAEVRSENIHLCTIRGQAQVLCLTTVEEETKRFVLTLAVECGGGEGRRWIARWDRGYVCTLYDLKLNSSDGFMCNLESAHLGAVTSVHRRLFIDLPRASRTDWCLAPDTWRICYRLVSSNNALINLVNNRKNVYKYITFVVEELDY
jgi:hypothetical protein